MKNNENQKKSKEAMNEKYKRWMIITVVVFIFYTIGGLMIGQAKKRAKEIQEVKKNEVSRDRDVTEAEKEGGIINSIKHIRIFSIEMDDSAVFFIELEDYAENIVKPRGEIKVGIDILSKDKKKILTKNETISNWDDVKIQIPFSEINLSVNEPYNGSAIISIVLPNGNILNEEDEYVRLRKLTREEDEELKRLISKFDREAELPEYKIAEEKDTSYNNCKRKQYKVIIDDNATKEEVRGILKEVYSKKSFLSDKIIIFVYKEFQEVRIDEALYVGRLFVNPDCEVKSSYEIDFNYWDIVHQNK